MLTRFFMLLSACVYIAGCSTVGVYSDEFSCPSSYNGRCVSMTTAHELALAGKDNAESDPDVKKKSKKKEQKADGVNPEEAAHVSYKESLYKKFDSLLKEPSTPVVAPPQVMRVLLLPYKGESNELYMIRHAYFFVDEPKWVFGDSIVAAEED